MVKETHLKAGERRRGLGQAGLPGLARGSPDRPTPAWNPRNLCRPVRGQIWPGGLPGGPPSRDRARQVGRNSGHVPTVGWPWGAGTEPQPRAPVTGGPAGRALAPSPAGCAWAGGMPAVAGPAPTPRQPTALLGTRPDATEPGLCGEPLAGGGLGRGLGTLSPAQRATQGRLEGAEPTLWPLTPPGLVTPTSSAPARRLAHHGTAIRWGHQQGPRDPGPGGQ